MKRIVCILLIFCLCFLLVGCVKKTTVVEEILKAYSTESTESIESQADISERQKLCASVIEMKKVKYSKPIQMENGQYELEPSGYYYPWKNKSEKTIKYITIHYLVLNDVGDATSKYAPEITGPFATGEGIESDGWNYNNLKVYKIDIEYVDQSTYTFEGEELALACPDCWIDENKVTWKKD